ncbi:hypothetical protein H8957_000137 [Semnopithecus entellus]
MTELESVTLTPPVCPPSAQLITRAALGSGGLAKEEKLPQPLGRGSVLCIESPYLPRTSLPGKRNTLPGRAAKGGEIQPERKSHADSSASPSCAGCIRRSATVQRAAAGARAGHSRPASSSPLEGAAGGAKPESERAKEHCPSVGTISGRPPPPPPDRSSRRCVPAPLSTAPGAHEGRSARRAARGNLEPPARASRPARPLRPGLQQRLRRRPGAPRPRDVRSIFEQPQDPRVPAERGEGHCFAELVLPGGPGWCDVCGREVLRQALRCANCKFTCHPECRNLIRLDCSQQEGSSRDRPSPESTLTLTFSQVGDKTPIPGWEQPLQVAQVPLFLPGALVSRRWHEASDSTCTGWSSQTFSSKGTRSSDTENSEDTQKSPVVLPQYRAYCGLGL